MYGSYCQDPYFTNNQKVAGPGLEPRQKAWGPKLLALLWTPSGGQRALQGLWPGFNYLKLQPWNAGSDLGLGLEKVHGAVMGTDGC